MRNEIYNASKLDQIRAMGQEVFIDNRGFLTDAEVATIIGRFDELASKFGICASGEDGSTAQPEWSMLEAAFLESIHMQISFALVFNLHSEYVKEDK